MIIGHQRQIRYLGRVLAKGTFAHAYLFSGPDGVGKRTIAVAAAQALLCSGKREGLLGGCGSPSQISPGKTWEGECEDCQLVAKLLHPDLIAFSPEQPLVEEKNEREIGIANIHELQRRLALSAWRGGRKVVIIDQAEALSRAAQSSLLKILEEPDEKTVFFIIARSSAALLPTVRSRCVPMRFTALGDDELAPLAAGIPARQAEELVALAEGRSGVLVRLVRDEKFREQYRAAAERSTRLRTADLAGAFAFSEEHGRDEGALESALTHLVVLARRDLHAAISASYEPNPRSPQASPADGDSRLARQASLLALILERLRILETTTANRRLVADGVFFELSSLNTRQP